MMIYSMIHTACSLPLKNNNKNNSHHTYLLPSAYFVVVVVAAAPVVSFVSTSVTVTVFFTSLNLLYYLRKVLV